MSWHLPFGYDFLYFSPCWTTQRARASSTSFLNHTHWHTLGRNRLAKWPPQRRDLCLTTHNTQTDINAPAGFKPAVAARERSQTYALDRAATGIGRICLLTQLKFNLSFRSRTLFSILVSSHCDMHKKLTDSYRLLRVVRASHHCSGIWVNGIVISCWSSL